MMRQGTGLGEPVLGDIGKWLKEAIGVDAELLGRTSVENVLRRRMAACRLEEFARYREFLDGSAIERQALIDAVIVPETWFFRDREAFTTMVVELPEDRAVRLLSVPCSTGEEPYSMAIALLEACVRPERFRIDAIDVSATNIATAEQAVYGSNSFRGGDLGFRGRYFHAVAGGKTPVEAARAQVRFGVGNLLDPRLLAGQQRYDAVFCRNLLIYFDRSTQEKVLHRLRDLLAPEGLLFVGAAEARLAATADFKPVRPLQASAFRKAAQVVLPNPLKAVEAKAVQRKSDPPKPSRAPRVIAPPAKQPAQRAQADRSPVKPPDLLDEARCLADGGHLVEAMQACELHLREHGPSADAFYLSGVMHDAAGQHANAAEAYRKALYLDPTHHEGIAHLALALRQIGDEDGARALQARLRRLSARSTK
jgi:chemotaxis protein methyltransferase WspC